MDETLGKRISFHRKRLSLTQDALAERLGITAQAVSKWENDQSCPDITMLPKLAEVFACTTDELLGISHQETCSASTIADIPEAEQPSQESPARRTAPQSPGAAFGTWLFLTGLITCVTQLRSMLISLEDVAIACGIFVFGLFGFLRRLSVLRLGCAVAGGLFVLNILCNTQVAGIDWSVPLAAALALFGLDLLIDTIRRPKQNGFHGEVFGHNTSGSTKNRCTYDGEHFDCTACFGAADHPIQLPRLSGGRATVTFGELIIDLSRCGKIAENCCIDLECAFGSLEILVPRRYRVEAATSSAFGAVDVKGAPDSDAADTISLKCKVSFGQITIRYI